MVKSPKVIFMMGLPGSGKSYLAIRLSNILGSTPISSDQVRKVLQKMGQYQENDKQAVYLEMQRQMKFSLHKKRDVIVDSTFYLEKTREAFEAIAKEYTNEIFWILASAEESIIKKRVSQKRPDSEADFEVYQLIRDKFEPLNFPYLKIDTGKFLVEENLNQILNYCHFDHEGFSN